MKVRTIVTGHSSDGKATIVKESVSEGFGASLMPGWLNHSIWGGDEASQLPNDGSSNTYHNWFPPVGGYRFIQFTIPPDGTPPPADLDMEAAMGELEGLMPGLLSTIDSENPAMHRSNTVDMLFILSGKCMLDLDNGNTTELKPGDALVQNGTRHAWKNPFGEPCEIVGFIVGAKGPE